MTDRFIVGRRPGQPRVPVLAVTPERMMLLSNMICDGCGRRPTLPEWFRGELTSEGYPEWRHPGVAFSQAGLPFSMDNRGKIERLFEKLFGRALPEENGFLCPGCQERVLEELPALAEADEGENLRPVPRIHREYLGREPPSPAPEDPSQTGWRPFGEQESGAE